MIRWFRSKPTAAPLDDPAGPGGGFGTERDPERLVFFSDAVFAIAVTLLVLEIHPPEDTRHLLHGLAALWPSYLSYAITFLLIGQVWANHHVMFDHIRVADRTVLFLNTLLLMDIAFLPFAASVWQPCCSTSSGGMRAMITGCSASPSTPSGPEPSAGASGSPWPGSAPGPCWAPCSPSSAWP